MKFQKHISLFLAFFLLVSNVGFAIDVHYCEGKIASVQPGFWQTTEFQNRVEESCCAPKSNTILEDEKSCCKDKIVHFQKKSENTTVTSIAFYPNFVFLFDDWKPIVFGTITHFENNTIPSYYCDANAPPLFQLYHQYIFYA